MDDLDDIAEQMDPHANVGTKQRVGSKRRRRPPPLFFCKKQKWQRSLRAYKMHKDKRTAQGCINK